MKKQDDIKDETQQQKSTKKKTGKMKIVLFILMICIISGGSFAAWHQFVAPKAESETIPFASPPMEFTVNLADTGQRHYLKAKVQLGYNNKSFTKEIEKRNAEVRDLIIEIFRSKTVTQIDNLDGMNKLRTDLRDQLNSRLGADHIVEVYFTEFIIQ